LLISWHNMYVTPETEIVKFVEERLHEESGMFEESAPYGSITFVEKTESNNHPVSINSF